MKKRLSVYLEDDVLEALRDAAVFLAGPPEHATVTSILNESVRREIQRLAKAYNRGRPFPARAAEPRRGTRPM